MILCEIKAILNSRPFLSLSDPNDLAYLNPGHFLIGTALNGFPCANLSNINENRLLQPILATRRANPTAFLMQME